MTTKDGENEGVYMMATDWEITDDDDELIAKFELFDAHSVIVNINEKILTPQQLRSVADKLEEIYKGL